MPRYDYSAWWRNRVVNPKKSLPLLLLTCFVLASFYTCFAASQSHAETPLSISLPSKGQNNFWYWFTDSDTVFVFVHGILSDSRGCWLYETESEKIYFPELIRTDPRPDFRSVSLYLAGYYTDVNSGEYGIKNAADEVFEALKRPDEQGRPQVMAKKNIIFIGHSTGGVVIRYMLESNHSEFFDKTIGLVLVASPSYGSRIADYLDPLSKLYNQRLGQELQWRSWGLEDLDDRFRKLLSQGRITRLIGIEGYENHFIIHHKLLPFLTRTYVVSKESAVRYFESRMLRNTDHFSTVKPNTRTHPGYELLYDFYRNKFFPLVMQTSSNMRKADDFFAKAEQFRVSGFKDDARTFYTEALALYKQQNNHLGQARALSGLGDVEYQLSKNDEARTRYIEALTFYKHADDPRGQADVLRRLGDLESRLTLQRHLIHSLDTPVLEVVVTSPSWLTADAFRSS